MRWLMIIVEHLLDVSLHVVHGVEQRRGDPVPAMSRTSIISTKIRSRLLSPSLVGCLADAITGSRMPGHCQCLQQQRKYWGSKGAQEEEKAVGVCADLPLLLKERVGLREGLRDRSESNELGEAHGCFNSVNTKRCYGETLGLIRRNKEFCYLLSSLDI